MKMNQSNNHSPENLFGDARQRHSGIVTPDDLSTPVTVIGAGAIGSWTVLCLAKLGVADITVYDFDTVSIENVGCQLYGEGDINLPKVTALQDHVKKMTGVEIKVMHKTWDGAATPFVISAVDSMEARDYIWKNLKTNTDVFTYIDGRMGGEFMRIYTVDMADRVQVKKYEATIDVAAEVEEIPCSERSIVYNTMIIAGLITQQVKKIVKEHDPKFEIMFDLPSYQLL